MNRRSILSAVAMMAVFVATESLHGGPAFGQSDAAGFLVHDKRLSLPAIEFVNDKGRPLTLAAFEGRTVILNIWATWCAPCRREMPTLDRLESQLGGDSFSVVALSVDRGGVAAVRAFFDELGIQHLKIYVDQTGDAGPSLRVTGLPTTLLIDPRGREIGRLIGPAEWDSPDMLAFLKARLAGSAGAEDGNEPPDEGD